MSASGDLSGMDVLLLMLYIALAIALTVAAYASGHKLLFELALWATYILVSSALLYMFIRLLTKAKRVLILDCMSRERILEVVLTMLGAVLLLIAAVGKHPYGFYMVLRLVITVGAVYWAWRVYKAGPRAWTWAFVAVALLLNPFLPIRMQRAQWQPIDVCLGILLIGWSGYWLRHKRRNGYANWKEMPK